MGEGEAGEEASGAELTARIFPTLVRRNAPDERELKCERDPHCARGEESRGVETRSSVSESGTNAYTEVGGGWRELVLHG